jgi:methylphosphotriester-DNA--protein-cysteine methyltransferase
MNFFGRRKSGAEEPQLPAFHEEYFRHLAAEVRNHPEKPWDFTEEAMKRNLTGHHFRRLFKARFRLSPLCCRRESASGQDKRF